MMRGRLRAASLKRTCSLARTLRQNGTSDSPTASSSISTEISSLSAMNLYKQNVAQGVLKYDEKQYIVMKHLLKLQKIIEQTVQSKNPNTEDVICAETTTATRRLRGFYLYGEVGTGKTMLMDMFFETTRSPKKKKVHFSNFMLEVHKSIHLHKKELIALYGRDIHLNLSSERDSLVHVARSIAAEADLLCFDEFQVTDICDAMILSRLFNELWKQGVVLVATSNRHPEELYQNGLNRQYFLPFIKNLQMNCIVKSIASERDYRQENLRATDAYFIPDNEENKNKLFNLFMQQLQGDAARLESVPVMMGRKLSLEMANLQHGACFVSFSDLCETDKGPADYRALCEHFHTIYMHGIPALSVLRHNEARRLITLVDAMYNTSVRFIWTAQCVPSQIFQNVTTEDISMDNQALYGTDHDWDSPACKESSALEFHTPHDGHLQQSEMHLLKMHPRGEEQKKMAIPLDSNLYYGVSVRINRVNSTESPERRGDSTASSHPFDAAQDNMKVLEGELASVRELGFAFRRASSRLTEMSGESYLRNWKNAHL